jgi:nicotinamide phosphoribosyltransferase
MKATNAVINGEERPIFKAPKTDKGEKRSAKGRLVVVFDEDLRDFALIDEIESDMYEPYNWLRPVWRNGVWRKRFTLAEIKENLRAAS